MTEPGFDLILGCNTMKELGIVLDFHTKEISIDEISLPMRDINNLRTKTTADKAWIVNNSIYQSTSQEPQSMLEATTEEAKQETKVVNMYEIRKDLRHCFWLT